MVNHANLTAVTHNIILIDQCAQAMAYVALSRVMS